MVGVRGLSGALLVGLVAWLGAPVGALAEDGGVRRFAVVVGSNDGGDARVRLRYAVTDARSVASVLKQLGGVGVADSLLLEEPTRARFLAALSDLDRRLVAARRGHRRTELLIYYSGHSDEHGLLLGPERLTYDELRGAIAGLGADVKIAILDSCSSGALIRKKGGARVAPFLVDDASDVSGQAFLTSSSATEAAQESDRLGASFFTHHLVSGLRGAADASGDGRVTLHEAYQFAFHETLARTANTQSGPQHANYAIDLTGTGDVVITDLGELTSVLVLDRGLVGRFFVRDEADRLLAEVQKSGERPVELGLEAGAYRVSFVEAGMVWAGAVEVPVGRRVVLTRRDFRATGLAIAHRDRGGDPWLEEAGGPASALDDPGETLVADDGHAGPDEGWEVVSARFSLVPGVSLSGPGRWQVVDGVALGLLGDDVGAVRGAQLTTLLGVIDEELGGLQLSGLLNVAGGVVAGVQLAGALNLAGEGLLGGQVAGGLNLSLGPVDGLMLAGGANLATSDVRGAMVAAGANYASGAVDGAQVSAGLNIADEVVGAQIGLVNIGGHVRGAQIGLVNYARSVDGVSLALVPIVAEGGYNHVEVWADTSVPLNVGARLGAPLLHVLLSAGLTDPGLGGACVARVGGGLGSHVALGAVYVDVDLTAHMLAGGSCDFRRLADGAALAQARLSVGVALTDGLAVFVGAAANGELSLGEDDTVRPLLAGDAPTSEWDFEVFPSFFGGVRLF